LQPECDGRVRWQRMGVGQFSIQNYKGASFVF
jgi:hypothetical protein